VTTSLDCLPCFLKQTVLALRLSGANQQIQKAVLIAVSEEIKKTDFSKPPAWTTTFIHRAIRKTLGIDPFKEVKSRYNQIALSLYPELKELVDKSPDPLWTATRLAIAGNVIDFGIFSSVDIDGTIRRALNGDIAVDHFEHFKEALITQKKVLYLLDNAGEIVFDRLLIELLKEMGVKVIAVVKGGPVLNDCTQVDARETSLDKITEVITNGSDSIGTILEFTSESFRKTFSEASLIISKGQGNFETLSSYINQQSSPISVFGGESNTSGHNTTEITPKKVFFLFQSKCEVVSRELGLPVGSMLLSSCEISP
jgi:uncharacterized protein with ATP-grasp and redox domains